MNVLELFPIEEGFEKTSPRKKFAPTNAVDKSGDLGFDAWYERYPRKQAREAAIRAWRKMSQAERNSAVELLDAHLSHWKSHATGRIHIPHASTWLNGKRWKDELFAAETPTAPAAPDLWFKTFSGMERKARELGLGPALPSESGPALKARIIEALDELDRQAASAAFQAHDRWVRAG